MKTLINKKFLKPILFACVFLLTFSSCKKIEPEVIVEGEAKIRVVNTVFGSNPQDIFQNSTKLNTTAIAFGENTSYLTVKSGVSTTIALKNANSDVVTSSAVVALQNNSSFTIFYYTNPSGEGRINGLPDDNTVPANGKSRVRFINFGAALGNSVNISLANGTAIVNGLTYEYASSYKDVDAGISLNVSVIGGETKVIPGTEFQSGKIYTVWLDAVNSTTLNYHMVVQN